MKNEVLALLAVVLLRRRAVSRNWFVVMRVKPSVIFDDTRKTQPMLRRCA